MPHAVFFFYRNLQNFTGEKNTSPNIFSTFNYMCNHFAHTMRCIETELELVLYYMVLNYSFALTLSFPICEITHCLLPSCAGI